MAQWMLSWESEILDHFVWDTDYSSKALRLATLILNACTGECPYRSIKTLYNIPTEKIGA